MSTSSVASAAGVLLRADRFRVKTLNRMTVQIMTIKSRLIANGEVLAFRVFSVKCVSFLEEKMVLVDL